MTINLTGGTRVKLNTTLPFTTDVAAETPVENANAIEIRVANPNYAPPAFNVTADITISDPNLVASVSGGFADVRVGDVLSNANITTGSGTVITKTDDDNITLDQNGTATAPGEVVAVTPGTIKATYYYLVLDHAFAASKVTITPTIYVFDGTKVMEGGSFDNDDNAMIVDASGNTQFANVTIDLDAFYTNARTPRTDT